MKIVVAPDSFKGCLSSREVAFAIADGLQEAHPDAEIVCVPVADGGEGTVEALTEALGARTERVAVADPLGRDIVASLALAGDTAILEMAAASGLPLLAEAERDPARTSTYGTGQLIRLALDQGCRRILIGIGGSATNDGGGGMLEALGWRFFDAEGNPVHGCGAALERIVKVDDSAVPAEVRAAEYLVACDVDTPFYGPEGAARVFAPQKGASPQMVERLDAGMRSFAEVVREATGVSLFPSVAGAGAAGGLGGALYAFLGASLLSGVEMVLDAVGFDGLLDGADAVVTGEGRLDSQSSKGKLVSGVLRRAAAHDIPVYALCGSVAEEPDGFRRVVSISEGMPLEMAMRQDVARSLLRRAAAVLL